MNTYDTIIIGGGTSGAALAGLLAKNTTRSVLLLEAGPDYGAYENGHWAQELLDARSLPIGHDWGYKSASQFGVANHPLERARVIGGCSSHNGCAAIWGSRADYDAWAALGNDGWATDDLLPFFRRANEALRVHVPPPSELTPWFRACLDAARQSGIPVTQDLNDLDENVSIGQSPVNIYKHVRWNTAFAYLDPVRAQKNMSILGQALVNRVLIQDGRVSAVECTTPEGERTIHAGQVFVCAGAYESPCILMRSGIGDVEELHSLGITPVHRLSGVGKNLQDHPTLYLKYSGTPELIRAMKSFEEQGGMLYSEQCIAKLRSEYCETAFDLHTFPIGGPFPGAGAGQPDWQFVLPIANMVPESRGSITLSSADPSALPVIDVGYLSDPQGLDAKILVSGLEIMRRFARQSAFADLIGQELPETSRIGDPQSMQTTCLHYYHPVGTCKMGPSTDGQAVVDDRGRVHGIENLYVADASIMPIIPRANTNIPALVVAERIASYLT
jgi:choline dehydrogenase